MSSNLKLGHRSQESPDINLVRFVPTLLVRMSAPPLPKGGR